MDRDVLPPRGASSRPRGVCLRHGWVITGLGLAGLTVFIFGIAAYVRIDSKLDQKYGSEDKAMAPKDNPQTDMTAVAHGEQLENQFIEIHDTVDERLQDGKRWRQAIREDEVLHIHLADQAEEDVKPYEETVEIGTPGTVAHRITLHQGLHQRRVFKPASTAVDDDDDDEGVVPSDDPPPPRPPKKPGLKLPIPKIPGLPPLPIPRLPNIPLPWLPTQLLPPGLLPKKPRPTVVPTTGLRVPTDAPTTTIPTDVPTTTPTDLPTTIPTNLPTAIPTDLPTTLPTDSPSDTTKRGKLPIPTSKLPDFPDLEGLHGIQRRDLGDENEEDVENDEDDDAREAGFPPTSFPRPPKIPLLPTDIVPPLPTALPTGLLPPDMPTGIPLPSKKVPKLPKIPPVLPTDIVPTDWPTDLSTDIPDIPLPTGKLPKLPEIPPALPTDLVPTDLPTNLPTDLPTDLPDLPTSKLPKLPLLPTRTVPVPTGLPTDLPPELPTGLLPTRVLPPPGRGTGPPIPKNPGKPPRKGPGGKPGGGIKLPSLLHLPQKLVAIIKRVVTRMSQNAALPSEMRDVLRLVGHLLDRIGGGVPDPPNPTKLPGTRPPIPKLPEPTIPSPPGKLPRPWPPGKLPRPTPPGRLPRPTRPPIGKLPRPSPRPPIGKLPKPPPRPPGKGRASQDYEAFEFNEPLSGFVEVRRGDAETSSSSGEALSPVDVAVPTTLVPVVAGHGDEAADEVIPVGDALGDDGEDDGEDDGADGPVDLLRKMPLTKAQRASLMNIAANAFHTEIEKHKKDSPDDPMNDIINVPSCMVVFEVLTKHAEKWKSKHDKKERRKIEKLIVAVDEDADWDYLNE